MADNFTANPGSGGDTFGADDIGPGVKYPRTKLIFGVDGTNEGDVATTNGLPVKLVTTVGTVSTANSTTSNLSAAAVFTGTSENVTGYAMIMVSVFASHASATDGLSLQQSSNGSNWDIVDTYTIPATTGKTFSFQPAASFYRLVYTNGGTLTTSLRIQTVFHMIPAKASSQRPQDALSNENDFEQTSAFLSGYNGTTWDRLRSVNTGYLGVTPHYAGTAASTGTGASGAQTQRVVTSTDSTIGTVTTVTTLTGTTTLTPGTGAANLGKAEDAAHASGDTGVMGLAVRTDTPATISSATGDYEPLKLAANGALWTTPTPNTAGGCTVSRIMSAASTNATNLKASAGQLYGWALFNSNAAIRYLKLYNSASAPTAGSGTPFLTILLPASSGTNVEFTMGLPMGTGIGYTIVTGVADTDATAVAANDVTGALLYK